MIIVLVSVLVGGYGAVALAAQPSPSAHAARDNEGICDWEGEILLVGFNYAQAGTVPAHGQLLQIGNHPHLFAIFGTRFGGNGTSTFGVPNLQGKAPTAGLHYVVCTSGDFPSPAAPGGHCNWLGQIILTGAQVSFPGTLSANGQLLEASKNIALFSIYGYTFGGSESTGKFGVPDLHGKTPIGGISYRVCTSGYYPDPNGGDGRCNWLGQVALFAYSRPPFATIPAHGQLLKLEDSVALFSLYDTTFGGNGTSTFGVPNLTGKAPPNLHYAVCTRGAYPSRT